MQNDQEMTTIPQLVEEVRSGKMPRRNFIGALTAMGVSTAGAGVIAAVAASNAFTQKPAMHVVHASEEVRNVQLHDQHLAKQALNNPSGMSNDYAEHAVVEDSMHPAAFVGRDAVIQRKGLASIPDLKIDVVNRVAQGSQVIAEWIAAGTHNFDFPGFPATGRQFSIRGVTVVIRQDDAIVRESLYYNMADVLSQLGA